LAASLARNYPKGFEAIEKPLRSAFDVSDSIPQLRQSLVEKPE
jgi:hypothetical protein